MSDRQTRDIRDLESELLRLEPNTRAALARTLLASLDDLSDEEYERLWAEEAEARYADFLAGRTTAVDGADVFARAHARVRGRRRRTGSSKTPTRSSTNRSGISSANR